jgi:hypothetical protein
MRMKERRWVDDGRQLKDGEAVFVDDVRRRESMGGGMAEEIEVE